MIISRNEKTGICGICSAGCGVIVAYDTDGRMISVRADSGSPFGMICKVGEQSPAIVYSRDRIRSPLRRNGPKGTYDFKTISWDEAYDEIAHKLQTIKAESGAESAAIYTGSGSFDRALCDVFQPAGVAVSSASSVLFPFGSPNTLGVGALCYVAFAMIAPHVTMGSMYIDMFSDIERADLIVVWGKNPAAHCPPDDFNRINTALGRGAKVIVIDPRRTSLAKVPGAEWIPIRPGSDGALALGMCNVLIEEEQYDENMVGRWSTGFDDFSRYVQHFRPEVVEGITGVPAERVRSLAIEMAESSGVAPVMYSGLEYNGNGVQTIRAVLTFWALAGQLDVPGGLCFKMKGNKFPIQRGGLVANPDVQKAAGHNDFPLYAKYRGEFHAIALPKAVLGKDPYPIRALLTLGASIITSWPRSAVWKKTLNALDFLVCVDRQWTADMAFADIVLPASTYYEAESYMVYGSAFRIRERLIEPVGEARYDFFILAQLAKHLGYGELYPQNEEELLTHVLSASPYSLGDVRNAGGIVTVPPAMMQYRKWEKGLLRDDGKPGFDTPSGTFEIASSVLEEYGYDPLPRYIEPKESPLSDPERARRFPLVFNSGARHNVDQHALHHTIPALSMERPFPTVMMNTKDAADRGIASRDKVLIQTVRGQVEMFALVTDDIVEGSIEASGMGGGALGSEEWQKACVNELTDLHNFDPISGFPAYKALLCQVIRTQGAVSPHVTVSGEYVPSSITETQSTGPRPVYLDHNATTIIDPAVQELMIELISEFGNPSSIYSLGKKAHHVMETARKSLAALLNCTPRRLVFTSGGSEANNLVIKGTALSAPRAKDQIVTSSIEHPSVRGTCEWLSNLGFTITYLPVDKDGLVSPDDLREAITDRTLLVSIMVANNETGTIQPIADLAKVAKVKEVLLHTDAVQAAGKIPVDAEAWGVDFLTLSAHKFYGPKGAGAVYIRRGVDSLVPLIHGGKQERGLRGGTENILSIAGMGRAAHLAGQRLHQMEGRVKAMRDALLKGIMEIEPRARLNGHPTQRLPNTLNVILPGIRGESLVLALDSRGILFSSGSACKSGSPEPSPALLAMGLTEEDAHCSVRFSLGLNNTYDEIERTLQALRDILGTSVTNVRFVSCR